MSLLNPQEEVVNPQGGIRFRAPPPDADPWNGFADWKVHDGFAWEVMKRVVKSLESGLDPDPHYINADPQPCPPENLI